MMMLYYRLRATFIDLQEEMSKLPRGNIVYVVQISPIFVSFGINMMRQQLPSSNRI